MSHVAIESNTPGRGSRPEHRLYLGKSLIFDVSVALLEQYRLPVPVPVCYYVMIYSLHRQALAMTSRDHGDDVIVGDITKLSSI